MLAILCLAVGGAMADPVSMQTHIERFVVDHTDLTRFYFLDASPRRRERLATFYDEWETRLRAMDGTMLSGHDRIDYLLLNNHVSALRTRLARAEERLRATEPWVPFRDAIVGLEEARWSVTRLDPRETAGVLDRIVRQIQEVRSQADAAERPTEEARVIIRRAADEVDALHRALGDWFRHFDGYHPEFGWWCRRPFNQAREGLQAYAKVLRERLLGFKEGEDEPMIGHPIGREAIQRDLFHEMMETSPEDLIRIAEREYAWCLEELKRAAREMGFGDDWRAAMDKVKEDAVPPGEQDQYVAELTREAIDFVRRRDLVTVEPLCEETWRVDMIPERDQRLWPFQFYGGLRIGVAYPVENMDHETKLMSLRGNNRHFARLTTQHELIPGHHLQAYMAQRHRAYRRAFSTPFFVEGWALHWEMLLWDLDFPGSPEGRIGFLFWRAHRCARIVVSLKFHLGEMTPEEMIDYLVENVGHERFTATSEVRRYIGDMYSPLYQCAYLIGGLQLREIYQSRVTRGGMSPRDFHDHVLRQGPIPMRLIAESFAISE